MGLHTKSLVFLAVAVARTFGAIYDQFSQLPTHTYDYVIVGGTSHDTAPWTEERNSAVIVPRWYRRQCACKPFDRKQQCPSPRPRGRSKVSSIGFHSTNDDHAH